MIDIAAIVAAIVKSRDASDTAAYTRHVHLLVRQYGQELLLNLAAAILPTTPEEQACVKWLQENIVRVAQQIPEPHSGVKPSKEG